MAACRLGCCHCIEGYGASTGRRVGNSHNQGFRDLDCAGRCCHRCDGWVLHVCGHWRQAAGAGWCQPQSQQAHLMSLEQMRVTARSMPVGAHGCTSHTKRCGTSTGTCHVAGCAWLKQAWQHGMQEGFATVERLSEPESAGYRTDNRRHPTLLLAPLTTCTHRHNGDGPRARRRAAVRDGRLKAGLQGVGSSCCPCRAADAGRAGSRDCSRCACHKS